MVKKEKAFVVAPRSLFDIVAGNDLTQLSISVKGVNPNDTSPGSVALAQKQRPVTSDGQSAIGSASRASVGTITSRMVAYERDAGGFTALHVACAHGHLAMIKILTEEYHCDVNAVSDSGKTPLYLAVEQGHEEVVAYLISLGANLRGLTRDEKQSIFGLAVTKQHHAITVRLRNALATSGYTTDDRDPLEAALQGDLFYFALEMSYIDAAEAVPYTEQGKQRRDRIAGAQDAAKNSIVSAIASQRLITADHNAIVEYLLLNGVAGDVNGVNANQNTAIHNLAGSCAERQVGDDLTQRVVLLDLLLASGANPLKRDSQGRTPAQCTTNAVLKLFFIAAEKKSLFMEQFERRNRIPLSERPAFSHRCKALKRDLRAADVAARRALADPKAAIGPTPQQSPGNTPRGSSTTVTVVVTKAVGLPTRSGTADLDPFVVASFKGAQCLRTPVVNGSQNPTWSQEGDGVVGKVQVAPGDVLKIEVLDKEVDGAADRVVGVAELKIASVHLASESVSVDVPLLDASAAPIPDASVTVVFGRAG